jgi:hypothetical protein
MRIGRLTFGEAKSTEAGAADAAEAAAAADVDGDEAASLSAFSFICLS